MKQIYSARDEVDAQLAKTALDEADIESVIQPGGLGSILGELAVSEETLPSLWVREEDADRASAVLTTFKANQPPPPTSLPWTCPNCREAIEPQFTACWKCGTARPSANP
jgi:hypothetical protein